MRREARTDFPVRESTLVANPSRLRQEFAWSPRFDDLGVIVRTALAWGTCSACPTWRSPAATPPGATRTPGAAVGRGNLRRRPRVRRMPVRGRSQRGIPGPASASGQVPVAVAHAGGFRVGGHRHALRDGGAGPLAPEHRVRHRPAPRTHAPACRRRAGPLGRRRRPPADDDRAQFAGALAELGAQFAHREKNESSGVAPERGAGRGDTFGTYILNSHVGVLSIVLRRIFHAVCLDQG